MVGLEIPNRSTMKFIKEETAGAGHTRYMFAMGKKEAQVMFSLLVKAHRYMPKTIETVTEHRRVWNMLKTIKEAIPEMNDQPMDDKPQRFGKTNP